MTVELISVGTELLLGNIVNTNAAYLAEKCADLGLSCFYQSVVGDNEERLGAVLKAALERSDIVILSGGLGPTEDDLTKEVSAKVMGRQLVMHEPSKKRIEEYFTSRNMELTENNWKQAMMPEGAIAVNNENGTAPGVIIEDGEKKVILLPGPPNEMIPMFEKSIMPYLEGSDPEVIYSQTVKICGVGESKAETLIKDMIDSQSNPTIATYAKNCEVHLRVTAKAAGEKEAKKLVKPVVKELKNRFGPCIYTTNADITLEKAVVDLLIANKLTVSTVESCTGGMLAARLINVSGVSDVYKSGYITYSNKAKRRILGIKKGLLEKKGAVSEEVAKEMAKGAAAISRAEVAVSITGIAGPGGGTEEKPVGLVYIACSVCGKIKVRKYNFRGNRAKIRETAVSSALILMRQCVLEYYSEVAF
ncbi:MAG: competence/damage-inducible protein A [Kineothrix sp.]|jgi:nicotinamide-nucleotide amidase|nr:competence/damage-inducible protein CinA domain [Lachnospiraceae bacterium 28-4]MCI8844922.1 competence/damage-inducible protein A [Lachnospiraceae bacterium]MCX4344440.1 competence/damage-inducible protein A [Kineothrix sp.]